MQASSPLQLRKGSSGGFNNSATFTFSQSAGDTEQAFQVRLKSRSVSTTANGWVTSVVTADPDGGSRGDVSDNNATLTHILMDRQNLASLEGKSDGSVNSNTGCAAASDACANRKEITLAEGDKASGLELTGLGGLGYGPERGDLHAHAGRRRHEHGNVAPPARRLGRYHHHRPNLRHHRRQH